MRSKNATWVLLATLLALTLYMYLVLRPFLPGIAWALVLVVVFRPVFVRLVA